MVIHPDNGTTEEYKKHKSKGTILCYGYEEDLIQIYDFYCARYENITYKEFLDKGISDIQRKLASIPEDEPLFKILKSRVIDITKIKDKEERKYWSELKEAHKIPDIYIPNEELDINLSKKVGGMKNGKRFM